MIDPGRFKEKILLRTAPEMTGPWTSGEVIYRMPEMIRGNPRHVKDNFCYAAKEHPEFESNGELLFTYVCNTMDVPSLATNLSIYFPKVVSIPMPQRIFRRHG
jgi:hypothetical protein